MPLLPITCPQKFRPLPTNVTLGPEGYRTAGLGTNTIGPCPHCGAHHTWTKADTSLAGAAPPPHAGRPPVR